MNVERTNSLPPAAATHAPEPVARAHAPAAARPAAEASAHEAALRDVLSPDERAFFDQIAALGPLTYGRPRGHAPSLAPTGQRLDVRG